MSTDVKRRPVGNGAPLNKPGDAKLNGENTRRRRVVTTVREPLLTADDERHLAQLIEQGDTAAKARFIRANMGLVVYVARRYPVLPGLTRDDLIQAGTLGLVRAVEKFDWRRGYKFSTYGVIWIRQAIQRTLSRSDLIRIPEAKLSDLNWARKEDADLDADLAHVKRVKDMLSLDAPRKGDPDGPTEGQTRAATVADTDPGPEQRAVDADDRAQAVRLLEVLDDRHRRAVELRFGLDGGGQRSNAAVGQALGLSTEGARKMLDRAIGQVRESVEVPT